MGPPLLKLVNRKWFNQLRTWREKWERSTVVLKKDALKNNEAYPVT
jgi:hypothetical protein